MNTLPYLDPLPGKPGLALIAGGILLHITGPGLHPEVHFWVSIACTCCGGAYYLFKIYFEYLKKRKK